ncbi:MAG: hypothetical protein AB1898_00115 [Acidobacteriota bacterium]
MLAGILSALVNFGLVYGGEITSHAVRLGADPAQASNAVWALVFTENYGVNISYCLLLLRRHRSTTKFLQPGTRWYWLAAALMGSVWAGGIVVYGLGAVRMGRFGAFVGFPIMLITSILTGNALGYFNGEWDRVTRNTRQVMVAGVSLLVAAILVLSYANQFFGSASQ